MHGYLRHLANFARIVEAGSMKSASDALGIAPSGLSDSMKVLENRLGTALLIRHKTGVTPTTEGERVYRSASAIVDLLGEALGPEDQEELTGTCRISVPAEVASTCFGKAIGFLRQQHPKLNLKIFAEDDFVDHSRFARDYFLRVAAKLNKNEGLRTIWTGRANAILVANAELVPEKDAEDAKKIAQLPNLVGSERTPPFGYTLNNPKERITFESAIGVSHPASQLSLAAQGQGVTGCLDICAHAHIRSGVLRQVLTNRFSIPLEMSLLTPHRRKAKSDDALAEAMSCLTLA
ncbi:MAG: LysR family transcriptional regulator [Pseudomonadota bacterium]